MEPVITTEGLTRRFGQTVAVDQLRLEVGAGEIFGFLGHNGAGKTTTVRLLNGILDPSAGSARVLGLDPLISGPLLRRRTGVLTETPSLVERLTAWDNLAIFADLYGVPQERVDSRIKELLAAFDLEKQAGEKVGAFSKGMKQRLAIARALLHRPEILFLDEPTAGLDPLATRHVHEIIERQARQEGHTVFLCTHNLVEAQRLCDRVAVMEHGHLVALGTPAELAERLVRHLTVELELAPEQASMALDTLQAISGHNGINLNRTDGHLTLTATGREVIPELVAGLVQAGIRVYRVDPQEPSLEDVYFALHDKAEVKS
jgi:ABC-2 type transport system ATP-binding protein